MKKEVHKHLDQGPKKARNKVTKYLLERDTLFATLWVFIFIIVLGLIPVNFYVLNPIKLALKDFDFNDLSYAKLKKGENTDFDKNIVVVNIGNAGRDSIAKVIEKVDSMKPKVMGLDVMFDKPGTTLEEDLHLAAAIENTKNLVTASKLIYTNKIPSADSGQFAPVMHTTGFVNMVQKDIQTIRQYLPREKLQHHQFNSFSSEIIRLFDSAAYSALEKRGKEFELINYTRKLATFADTTDHFSSVNKDQYLVYNSDDIINNNVDDSALAGKIVLIGYVSRYRDDILDKKFTPMNQQFVGKSFPDMNGIIVHANIISMVLEKNYIKKLPSWVNWAVAILIGWLHMSFFIHYYLESHIWFHLVAKIAQLASAILFAYIGMFLFDQFRIKIDMKMTLVVIVLAVDVIYFYEAWASWMHRKYNYHTVFKPHHH